MKVSSALAVLFFLFVSCATVPPPSTPGMVYDEEGRPLSGVEVRSEGTLVARSDVNGRFVLGPHASRLDYGREGYEPGSLDLGADPEPLPGSVIYLKLPSRDQLLKQAWSALDRSDYAAARQLLDRAEVVGQRDGFWAVTKAATLLLDPTSQPGALQAFVPGFLAGQYGPIEEEWKRWWQDRLRSGATAKE